MPQSITIAINGRWLLAGKLEGTGWYSHSIIKLLIEFHPEVDWHIFYDRTPKPPHIYPGVKCHVLRPAARHPWLWSFWNEWLVPKKLMKIKASVYWSPDGLLPSRKSLKDNQIKLITTIHDLNFIHRPKDIPLRIGDYYRQVCERSAKESDRILAVSETTKNDIILTYSIKNKDIDVTYNAPQKDFTPLSEKQKKSAQKKFANGNPYFCFLGAFTRRKNLKTLVEAFNKWTLLNPKSKHQLVIAGRPLHEDEELNNALKNGKKRILLPGFISRDQLNDFFGGATAFVFPSYFEGFGIPIIEAMASNCLVLSSNSSCMPEIANDAAHYSRPENIEDWISALNFAIQNEEDVKLLKAKGLERAKYFKWEHSADQVWESFKKILSNER